MITSWKTRYLVSAALLLTATLYGCGGGGGGGSAIVSGAITDIDGSSVAGAAVSIGGNRTTSLSNGAYTLNNVADGYQTVDASITINGHRWSGRTVADVVDNQQNSTINIMVTDERTQGGIGGTVIDPNGIPLSGAKVFVAGPYSSTMEVTDRNGNYEIDKLAGGVQYTVTASLAGYTNDTKQVTVTANQVNVLSFALSSTGTGNLTAPQNVRATSLTVATDVTRASSQTKSVYEWLKRISRKRLGLPDPVIAKQIELKSSSRVTPNGALIETDLFWDYASFPNLFGYLIQRGRTQSNLADIAVLRDPLATAYFDADYLLTPDLTYYYTVSRLDTINFPNNGAVGPASAVISVQPLDVIRATSPTNGNSVTGNPTFQWTAVSGAAGYQIYVWNRFPDLQSETDPNGAPRIWPADLNNPGASFVTGQNTTSAVYSGPALQSGQTYYWMVVAQDSTGINMSATHIAKFTER